MSYPTLQTIHTWWGATRDATAGTGDIEQVAIAKLPATSDIRSSQKVRVLALGFKYLAASGAVTTSAEINLDKRNAAAGTSVEIGDIFTAASQDVGVQNSESLNTTTADYTAAPDYPELDLSAGDYLMLAQDTQGIGGTQSIQPYVQYQYMTP